MSSNNFMNLRFNIKKILKILLFLNNIFNIYNLYILYTLYIIYNIYWWGIGSLPKEPIHTVFFLRIKIIINK